MEEEVGGGALSTPLIGGGGALSLLDESGEQGVYRSPPPKTKKAVWHRWGGRCGVPTVQGYTIPLVKLMKNAARCTK